MKGFIFTAIAFSILAITGCQKDIPEPEAKISVQPLQVVQMNNDIPVSVFEINEIEPFYVNHKVDGQNVFIECIIQGISFRETAASNRGKIILYVNGIKKEEISSAAFIVKGLPIGRNHLKLVVVKADNSAIVIEKEFDVTI
ncbi:hypothetical protein J2Z40_000557 [Cytobacillus eiseniae]|uniref:PrcB C-terminal domain-containing protein n=1 Tax=Cytobacillus eiseniae TaxID=762947 RepID=A0ABS4RBC6_9BACI|nr:hypothetical protein [Cytobacillus eiseniae]MBP2240004.1 hypothetical protein [Cytobacillus eiseniae]